MGHTQSHLFIIFLDPLLRWLWNDSLGYHFNTSTSTCNTTTYANDLVIISDNITHNQPQIHKKQMFSKLAITWCRNKSKLKPITFKPHIKAQSPHTCSKPIYTHTTNAYMHTQAYKSLHASLKSRHMHHWPTANAYVHAQAQLLIQRCVIIFKRKNL